jgi:hypothetical protein
MVATDETLDQSASRALDTSPLQAPDTALDSFHEHALRKGTHIYRAHPRLSERWYFSSNEFSRFNLSAPNGTCYVSRDVETAISGVLTGFSGWTRCVTEAHVNRFVVSRLTVRQPLRLANIAAAKAQVFGVRRELTGSVDMHSLTQKWAEAFLTAGFDGISYTHRFAISQKATAIALFALTGSPTYIPSPEDAQFSAREAARSAGFTVVPIPARGHLSLI